MGRRTGRHFEDDQVLGVLLRGRGGGRGGGQGRGKIREERPLLVARGEVHLRRVASKVAWEGEGGQRGQVRGRERGANGEGVQRNATGRGRTNRVGYRGDGG